jgi:tetratricopeptide (TPR) repeat protein
MVPDRRRPEALVIVALALLAIGLARPALSDDVETAKNLMEEGWWDDAAIMFEKLLETEDSNPEIYNGLAEIYMMKLSRDQDVDWGKTEDYAKKAIELDPDNASYYVTLADIRGLKAMKGSKLRAMGRAKGAREAVEQAVKLEPQDIEARNWLIQYHIQAPGIAGGDKKEAYKQASMVARLDSLQGFLAQALILEFGEEDHAGAEAALLSALALGEEDPQPYFEYGYFCARRGEHARAESISAELLAREWCDDDSRKRVHESLGFMNQGREEWEKATSQFEQALKIDPTDASVSYQIGRTLLFAEADLSRAERIFRDYTKLTRVKGWWPGIAGAHYRLAQVYRLMGETDQALEEVDAALEIDSDHEGAKDLRNDLK